MSWAVLEMSSRHLGGVLKFGVVVYRTAETATGLFEKRQIFSETYKKPMVRCENVLGTS